MPAQRRGPPSNAVPVRHRELVAQHSRWSETEIAVVRVTPVVKDLVLIGGGHAHVHVLKSFAMKPMPGLRITLIARDVETPYSGMLPGFIAGHYTREDCHIDLRPLARCAGARLIHDEAMGLDLAQRRVACRGRPPLVYDVVSIDIGSTPHLGSIPGAAEHATPVKPIDRLAERWERIMERVRHSKTLVRFLTVGGGAAGVELTLSMRHRLRGLLQERGQDPDRVSFTLVTREELLTSHNASVRRWFRDLLELRGVGVVEQNAVERVDEASVLCSNGDRIGCDELIWVTQAGAASWLADTGLELDEDGFIKIDATLRALSDPYVFAAGDVASNVEHPRLKAGVFAVRQGPPLAANLRRALAGEAALPFVPQRKFLSLISTGDRCAVASRGRLAAQGATLWHLKDWIDRRWMRKYKELPQMALAAAPSSGADDPLRALQAEPMRCGGCGAKVGAAGLARVIARLEPRGDPSGQIGLGVPDDAAVVSPPQGKLLVQTVDFFRALIDDPYLFGRIAANHALGDIYAMGAEPLTALATATVPYGPEDKVEEEAPPDAARRPRCAGGGGRSVGRRSTAAKAPRLGAGSTINGAVDPDRVLRKSGMRVGDRLILTKPLRTRSAVCCRDAREGEGCLDRPGAFGDATAQPRGGALHPRSECERQHRCHRIWPPRPSHRDAAGIQGRCGVVPRRGSCVGRSIGDVGGGHQQQPCSREPEAAPRDPQSRCGRKATRRTPCCSIPRLRADCSPRFRNRTSSSASPSCTGSATRRRPSSAR